MMCFMKRIVRFISVISLLILLSGCATTGGPLHIASGQGDLKTMKDVLNSGADPNEHEGDFTNVVDGWSPAGGVGLRFTTHRTIVVWRRQGSL